MNEQRTYTEESAAIPAAAVTLVEGATFAICGTGGDINGRAVGGLFVADTRVCSRLLTTVDDQPIDPLTVAVRSPFAASFVGRTPGRDLLVFRDLWVGRGMRVDLQLRNLTEEVRTVVVRVSLTTDLADMFAVKEGREIATPVTLVANEGKVKFLSEDGQLGMIARGSDGVFPTGDGSLHWMAEIGPHEQWTACVGLSAIRGGEEVTPRYRCDAAPEEALPATRHAGWSERVPSLRTDVAGLESAFDQAADDLGALRLFDSGHPDEAVIAAGAPWYMTLFGRDSILTSWMALLVDPGLAMSTARVLARLQGRRDEESSEEQPGRILHELRFSQGPSLALADGDVYFGSVDATPLFVMLVHELWRWGVPLEELQPVLPAVDAALAWLQGPGDPDGDGYIEYARRAPDGLANQGWKDSFDGVSFADGGFPEPPIALAEVQAYAYAAWKAGAALAVAAGDNVEGARRAAIAEALQWGFDQDFWLPDQGAYAVALDRDKKPVDSITSNMGHCLWSGIAKDPKKAASVARWLVSDELFSGWGVRTLATTMARYNPLSYHNGSVWPHDTAICIAGLRKAGFVDEALKLADGLLAAGQATGGRLPELFAGITAKEMPVPVPYPASCSPQAWASAAPLLVMRALLGLDPDVPNRRLRIDPVLPAGSTTLHVSDLPMGESRVTIEVEGDAVAVRGLPRGLALIRPTP